MEGMGEGGYGAESPCFLSAISEIACAQTGPARLTSHGPNLV
jgi:hypothetical protein